MPRRWISRGPTWIAHAAIAFTWLIICGAPSHARAALVTWEFEAVVRTVADLDPSASAVLFPGQVLRGSLTWDTDPLVTPRITSLTVEASLSDGSQPGPFSIVSGEPEFSSVFLAFSSSSDQLWLSAAFDPYLATLDRFSLSLWARDGTFGGEAPESPPPLDELAPFNATTVLTGVYLRSAFHPSQEVGAELILLRAVPEPASSALASIALLALACFRHASRGSIAA